ncbi:MAG TPA: Crp/Fnr family transcriptional regulator [Parvibaculum sp.]
MMPLYKRLSYYAELSEDDFAPLRALAGQKQLAERGRDIIVAGQAFSRAFVVQQGWAIRYQMLKDGRRQILNVMMPGDMFDLQVFVTKEADHSVMAVTDMELLTVSPGEALAMLRGQGSLALSFWWAAAQEEAILRQQIVRNGRNTARERVAHFLLELHRRAQVVSEGDQNGFHMPLTQTIIGDALGLSHIHVNRVLRKFMIEKLIRRERSWLELLDQTKLAEISDFDASYLDLDSASKRIRMKMSLQSQDIGA